LSDQGKGIIRKTHQKFQYEKDYRQVDRDFQLRPIENVAEMAFTLSAFGLPEPEGVVWDRGSNLRYYLFATGAVCLAGALYWRKRKHQARAARPSELATPSGSPPEPESGHKP